MLGRVVRFESTDGLLDAYTHIQNDRGTIGVLVELGGVDPSNEAAQEVAHEIALHIAFAAPRVPHPRRRPGRRLERERAVIEEQSRNEGVPEAKLEGASRVGSTGSTRTSCCSSRRS